MESRSGKRTRRLVGCFVVSVLLLFVLCGAVTAYVAFSGEGVVAETDNFMFSISQLDRGGGPNVPLVPSKRLTHSFILWPESKTSKMCRRNWPWVQLGEIEVDYWNCKP
jgi:hypothetical protein